MMALANKNDKRAILNILKYLKGKYEYKEEEREDFFFKTPSIIF